MTNSFGLMIESLVAVLLVLTIGYCFMLNKRLQRLRADEQTLKATIAELITATEIAERAIAGLRLTVQECDAGLGQRLKSAELLSIEMARQITAGEQIVGKLVQIAGAARVGSPMPAAPSAPPAASSIRPDAQSTAVAAQAFATRARLRVQGAAA